MPRGRWPTLMVLHDLQLVGVDHRDGVALLVRDIGQVGAQPALIGSKPSSQRREADAWRHMPISPYSLQPAFGFGPIVAERIEFGDLMQETFLRRDRDDHAAVGQQDRLAQLQVPVAQGQPLPLEGRDAKNPGS